MKKAPLTENQRNELADKAEDISRSCAMLAARMRGDSVPDESTVRILDEHGKHWCPLCGCMHVRVNGYAFAISADEMLLASGSSGGGYFGAGGDE